LFNHGGGRETDNSYKSEQDGAAVQKTILSTADVARLFHVTETTVKRWADEGTLKCQKTPGGHRKFDVRNVVEFVDRTHFEPVGVLQFPGKDELGVRIEVAILGRDFASLAGVFVEKALSPDKTDLFLFLSFLYQHHVPLWEIFDSVIRPGMCEIGERWERGQIGVNHEHRASHETLDAMARLQAEILIKPATGHSAVFACVGDESHEIGLRCASYVFESEGWRTQYLGANTPYEAVIAAVREMRPTAVCLSITRKDQPQQQALALEGLASAAHAVGARCVVGGAVARGGLDALRMVDRVFASAREVLDFIEEIARKDAPTRMQN